MSFTISGSLLMSTESACHPAASVTSFSPFLKLMGDSTFWVLGYHMLNK